MHLDDFASELRKALDLSDVTGVLTQPEIDKVIQDVLDHNSPLRANIPRRQGSGESWLLNRKTAQPGLDGFVNDTEEPTSVDITRGRVTFPFKTIMRRGKVTTFAQEVGASYKDLLAQEIEDVTLLVRDDEESAMINGDSGANAKSFDGLRVQIATVAENDITGPGVNGDPISVKLLDQAMDVLINARPNILISSKRTRRDIWNVLQTNQRFTDMVEVKGGFRVSSYAGVPIFYSPHIPDNQTKGSATNATELYFLDTQFVFMAWLSMFRMIALAKKSAQFDEFDIRGSESFVVANIQRGAVRLSGLIPLP